MGVLTTRNSIAADVYGKDGTELMYFVFYELSAIFVVITSLVVYSSKKGSAETTIDAVIIRCGFE